jgi:polyisoprenoid-binding protein YceI
MAHLRSADFFEAGKYPSITFTVQKVTPVSDGVTVTGSLTVRDRTQPVSFGATVSTFDGDELWLDAELKVNRADYGLTWNQMGMASMQNTIVIHAVFTRR